MKSPMSASHLIALDQVGDRLLTTADVKQALGINKDAIGMLFRQGEKGDPQGIVGAFKLQGQWRCTKRAFNDYIERMENPSKARFAQAQDDKPYRIAESR